MRRFVAFLIACSLAVAACTRQEPTGPLTAAALSANKQVLVTPAEATIAVGETQQFAAQYFQGGKEKKATRRHV